jgi:hypothetical protein
MDGSNLKKLEMNFVLIRVYYHRNLQIKIFLNFKMAFIKKLIKQAVSEIF